ncbi:MAG: Cache 3/Cache 2 fusion domain-containing protein, partial [Leptothrix sp. (in: b-proteobacteria)]
MSALVPATQSVARKITVSSVLGLAAVLVVLSAVMGATALRNAQHRAIDAVAEKTTSIAQTIDAFDMTSRVLVQRFFGSFQSEFAPDFKLVDGGADLLNGGKPLAGQYDVVDRFAQRTGGVATIFARKGDGFVRISTSVKKEGGERAVGTALDPAHPAFKQVLAGEPYTGRANLFGKPYMTRYEPVRDAAGQVVGILFIGFDVTAFDASVAAIGREARFFEHGGVYIIDPRKAVADAVFVSHPTAVGQKVSDVLPQWAELQKAISADDDGVMLDAPPLQAGLDGKQWLVMRQSKGAGWWVVSHVSQTEAMADTWAMLRVFWAGLGVALVLLASAILLMTRRWVAAPLHELQTAVLAVAEGDLSRPFHSERRDEIGMLVNAVEVMRSRLTQMLSAVHQSVESIHTASGEIASGNQDLSSRTEQTASNLQQTASSMEQITVTVRHTADSARTANQLASSAAEAAQRGGAVVAQVITNMDEINASSRQIAEIIGTIDGIAFQTNILALNAAVEAARAGEQGRGFAVVATEVRNLAQRSANAAREIKSLIGASVDKVESGSRLVNDAGSTMTEIVSGVQRVCDIIG